MDKVKFTKASKRDNGNVTVSLVELRKQADVAVYVGNSFNFYAPTELALGQEFVLTIEGVRTLSIVNREGKTAITKTFPRKLRLPSVGKPVFAEVDNILETVG